MDKLKDCGRPLETLEQTVNLEDRPAVQKQLVLL